MNHTVEPGGGMDRDCVVAEWLDGLARWGGGGRAMTSFKELGRGSY